jgi:hypothetical protein
MKISVRRSSGREWKGRMAICGDEGEGVWLVKEELRGEDRGKR